VPRVAEPAASAASASAGSPAEAASEAVLAQAAPEAPPAASAAPAPEAPASAAPVPSEAASAPAFRWPASTRLSYDLTGNYRGEIHGSAQVEWVRVDRRYQVHLDVVVGLPIFPLLSRRMSSEGELTPDGLRPERYDEENRQLGRPNRRFTIRFEPDAVLLPDGRRRTGWPGVQDAASQFVQLAYLFTTHPEQLTPGQVVSVPLALARHVDYWLYDVMPAETVATAFGPVETVPLKPRRVATGGGDLSAEIWFAPALAYLPARIRIRQDADTFIDLVLKRKPELAAS